MWTIKDGYRLGDDIQSKVLAFAFGLAAEIERTIKEFGYWICSITGGYLKINAGEPFAVHMTEPNDDTIRRIKINIEAEFLTAY